MAKVYLDLGTGWQEVTHLVRWDDFSYTFRGFSTDYKNAENEASFTLNYDETLYGDLVAENKYVGVKITDDSDVSLFLGEAQSPLSRSYTGELVESQLQFNARDYSRRLQKPVGDLTLFNAKICDPNDTANSIVHQLMVKAGFTTGDVDSSVTIPTVITAFSPTEESEILSLMSTLLYEYGYAVDWDTNGQLSPIQWRINSAPIIAVGDEDIRTPVQISSSGVVDYTGVKVTYYEVGNRPNTRVFTDSDLPFSDDGTFAGYSIAAGTKYPVATNAIDTVTGQPQVVYQEYSDAGITYFTNKTQTDPNLKDFNRAAFPSDFSDIIATSDWDVDWHGPGLTLETHEEYSKKARYVWKNNTGAPLSLFWFTIDATVYYKTAARTITAGSTVDERTTEKYEASFLYTSAAAEAHAKFMAARYAFGDIEYKFSAEDYWAVGTPLTITLGDGSTADCLVREVSWNPQTEAYSYSCKAYVAGVLPAITSSTYTQAQINALAVVRDASVSTENLIIPYNTADPAQLVFDAADVNLSVKDGGYDKTMGYTITATPTNCTGTFTTQRKYHITGLTAATATVSFHFQRGAIEFTKVVTVSRGVTPVRVQWSVDGVSNWHTNYVAGDFYSRQSTDGGNTWSNVQKSIGDGGADGINGDRTAVLDLYKWSASVPTSFPSGTSTYTWATAQFTNPGTLNGWSQTPTDPVAGQTLYLVRAIYADKLATATSAVSWPASPTPRALNTAPPDADIPGKDYLVLALPFEDVPAYPDGTAAYVQDKWETTDGWSTSGGGSVTALDGYLFWTHISTGEYLIKTLVQPANSTWAVRIKFNYGVFPTNGTVYLGPGTGGQPASVKLAQNGDWVTVSLKPTANGNPYIVIYTDESQSGTFELAIDWIYIGDGSYSSKVIDTSKSALRLNNVGAVPVPGVSGNALAFNGNSVVLVPQNLLTTSISMWFRCTGFGTQGATLLSNTSGTAYVILGNDTGSIPDESLTVCISGAYARVHKGTNYYLDNTWHHLAVVLAGTDTKIYIDGVSEAITLVGTPTPATVLWEIGRYLPSEVNYNYKGEIDELYLWKGYALTEQDVSNLYHYPKTLSPAYANTRTAYMEVYKWSATVPTTFPAGTSRYDWQTGVFTAPTTPNGWSLTPGAAVSGQTLYGCSVNKQDFTVLSATDITWDTNVAYAVGAAANQMSVRYSLVDGAPWTATASTGKFMQTSVDGGVTWSASIAINSENGAPGFPNINFNFTGGVAKNAQNKLGKISGNNNTWDGQAYSNEAYTGGAFLGWKTERTDASYMLALNSDPSYNGNYDSLDYAWYIENGGSCYIWESGGNAWGPESYSVNDTFSILYTATTVTYYHNGVQKRQITVSAGMSLYLDSSFATVHAGSYYVSEIYFAPGATQGPAGPQGDKSYTHTKFSNDGGASFTRDNGNGLGETVGTWMGTYTDWTIADSTSVGAYTWTKLGDAYPFPVAFRAADTISNNRAGLYPGGGFFTGNTQAATWLGNMVFSSQEFPTAVVSARVYKYTDRSAMLLLDSDLLNRTEWTHATNSPDAIIHNNTYYLYFAFRSAGDAWEVVERPYNNDDTISITYDGSAYKYYHNNELVLTKAAVVSKVRGGHSCIYANGWIYGFHFASSGIPGTSGTAPPEDNLVLALTFEDVPSDGTQNSVKVIDASQSNIRLTNTGAVPVPGVSGNALSLNGSSFVWALSTALNMTTGATLSFSGWIKPTGNYSDYRTIIANRYTGTYNWQFYLNTGDGTFRYYDSVEYSSGVTPTANVWSHVAGVVDTSGNLRMYINGIQVGAVHSVGAFGIPSDRFAVGQNGEDDEYFIGALDELLVWKGYALTAENVKWLYANKTLPGVAAITSARVLEDISGDNVLSQLEKPSTIREVGSLQTEYPQLTAQASALSVDYSAYTTAYNTWNSYLGGLLLPVAWNDTSANTTIDGPTFKQNFLNLYTARDAVKTAIQDKQKTNTTEAQASADSAGDALFAYGKSSIVRFNGGSYTRSAGGGWGAALLWSTHSYPTAYISAIPLAGDGMINLHTSNSISDWVDTVFKLYWDGSTAVFAMTGASGVKADGSTYSWGSEYHPLTTFVAGDVLLLTYDGTYFTGFKNGVQIVKKAVTVAGNLYGIWNGSSPSSSMRGLTFGALTANSLVAAQLADAKAVASQTSANTANSLIADIADDNKITASEKSQLRKEWNIIDAEIAGNVAQANSLSPVVSSTAYVDAFTGVGRFMNGEYQSSTAWPYPGTVPSWISDDNLGTTTDMTLLGTGAGLRARWQTYYTARTALLNAIATRIKTDAATDATNKANARSKVFYQTTAPTATAIGDLWVETDANNKLYTWNGSSWIVTQDSSTAQATADGKATVYYQTGNPGVKTANDNGDLWVDTDDNNKLYSYSHGAANSGWVLIQDAVGAPAVYSPKYLGAYTFSAGFSGYPAANKNDWIMAKGCLAGAANANYIDALMYNGTTWVASTNQAHYNAAASDIIKWCQEASAHLPPTNWTFIENLVASQIFAERIAARELTVTGTINANAGYFKGTLLAKEGGIGAINSFGTDVISLTIVNGDLGSAIYTKINTALGVAVGAPSVAVAGAAFTYSGATYQPIAIEHVSSSGVNTMILYVIDVLTGNASGAYGTLAFVFRSDSSYTWEGSSFEITSRFKSTVLGSDLIPAGDQIVSLGGGSNHLKSAFVGGHVINSNGIYFNSVANRLTTGGINTSFSNASGGYIRYSDGNMECWGVTGTINTGSSVNVDLPAGVSYVDTNYNIQATVKRGALTSGVLSAYGDAVDTNTLVIALDSEGVTTSAPVMWRTMGRWY